MVTVKGKLYTDKKQVAEDRITRKSVGLGPLKIYSEVEKSKIGSHGEPDNIRKSVPVKEGVPQTNPSDIKVLINDLEKGKAKCSVSGNKKFGRKALADVSNVRGNTLRNEVLDGTRPLKVKSERSTSLQRVSVGPSTRTSASTSKPFLGKVNSNLGQGAGTYQKLKQGNYHKLKQVGVKHLKACSNEPGAKGQSRKPVSSNEGRIVRNLLPPTRKSLPVKRRAEKVDARNGKEFADYSEKAKGKIGFPVKGNGGRKAVLQGSNSRSRLWRSRASDGFIFMASKSQSNLVARELPRNLYKPNTKPRATVSNARMTLNNKRAVSSGKVTSVATVSSNRDEAMSTSYHSENAVVTDSNESTKGNLPSDANSCAVKDTSNVIPVRKSGRRRSYTSLLMTISKQLEEHGELAKEENLPSIDDAFNHLEAAEYVDDIYQYYWVSEAQCPPLSNYMSIQTDLSPEMRGILINWLIEVHLKFDLMQETLYLMVTLLDQYLSSETIKKNELQLVGLTALLLASKYEDFWHPKVKDLVSISAESYTRDQMLKMEKAILKKLKFRLNAPTPYVFMLRFIKAAQSGTKFENLAFYLIELCLVEYEALKYKPSLLCASAIYLARCTLKHTPAWSPLLAKHARYGESQIRECAEMILRFHKGARCGTLKVTYDKYRRPERGCVSAVKPLDRLPR